MARLRRLRSRLHSLLGVIHTAPVRSETNDYAQVATSRFFTCGRKTDGALKCWAGAYNLLPTTPQFDPDPATDGDETPYKFTDIKAGDNHICGLTSNANGQTAGKVICWAPSSQQGSDQPGGLGNYWRWNVPSSSNMSTIFTRFDVTPNQIGADFDFAGTTFSQLAVGGQGNCLMLAAGADKDKPRCWNSLRRGGNVNVGTTEPDLPMSTIAMVGSHLACGIVKTATTIDENNPPTPMDSSDDTAYVAGQVVCWGANENPSVADRILIDEPTTGVYTDITVGRYHACALSNAGKITCWGKGSESGATTDYGQKQVPSHLSNATFSKVFAGQTFTCGLLDGNGGQVAGTVKCWGEQNMATIHPNRAIIAYGATVPWDEHPRIPTLAATPDAMDVNRFQTCALTASGNATCWGQNAPYGWPPPNDVKALAAGFSNTCYLRDGGSDDGKAFCAKAQPPTAVQSLRFSKIYAGLLQFCGIIDDRDKSDGDDTGKAKCWNATLVPTAMQNLTFKKLTAGHQHACGIQTNGKAKCWGNVTITNSNAEDIPNSLVNTTFADIDAGWWYQTCAIEAAGSGQIAGKLRCWRSDYPSGGTTHPLATVPADIQDLRFKKISAGREHNCALTTTGIAKCWGLQPIRTRHRAVEIPGHPLRGH